jgi:uncharacterized glyoxalase superfamily protein PhnB
VLQAPSAVISSSLRGQVPLWAPLFYITVSLSIQIKSTTEAERIFHELGKDGRVAMPLEKTFWAARFGMLVDRFGIPWLINCEGSEQPPEG